MRLSKNTLSVMVNPFCAPLGEDGRAQALVAHDPSEQIGRDYVGARVLPIVADSKARAGNPFGPSVKAVVSYRVVPEKVPHTTHYAAQIKSGETFPCDVETARAAGVAFVGPALECVQGAASEAARSFGGSVADVWAKQGLEAFVPAPAAVEQEAVAPTQEGSLELADVIDQAQQLAPAADKDGDA